MTPWRMLRPYRLSSMFAVLVNWKQGCLVLVASTCEKVCKTKEHMSSLVVVPKNELSEGMEKKCLPLDLYLDYLKLAYKRAGIEGLRGVLSEKFKP